MKAFKYQIKLKVLLSKQKENGDRELTTVYLIPLNTVLTNLFKKFCID